jgi:hypothetical protein
MQEIREMYIKYLSENLKRRELERPRGMSRAVIAQSV